MTQTIDSTEWPTPIIEPTPAFDLTWQTNDYARRIHWWVRLFGIIWIVVPILAVMAAISFLFVGGAAMQATEISSSYDRCISSSLFTVAECARMYPR